MSVYVDSMRAQYGRLVMCHMIADTLEELHAMADAIGVKRQWFQHKNKRLPHYDICMSKRALAVKLGAQEIDQRETVLILQRRYGGKTTSKKR